VAIDNGTLSGLVHILQKSTAEPKRQDNQHQNKDANHALDYVGSRAVTELDSVASAP
jgi:hypothetical protein